MKAQPFIKSIQLRNFLSFGDQSEAVPLQPLNIIIGANGSGKSNFLEAFELLRNTPNELVVPIRKGGGVAEWLWKGGEGNAPASIEVRVSRSPVSQKDVIDLRYNFAFTAANHRLELVDEKIEDAEKTNPRARASYFYYRYQSGKPVLNIGASGEERGGKRMLQRDHIDPEKSILAQRRDPDQYPELAFLAQSFGSISLFREWTFGRNATLRQPQRLDAYSQFLLPDASNLALVLNSLERMPSAKQRLLEALKEFYEDVENYGVDLTGGLVQLYLHEKNLSSPVLSARLSDGTLRYLALLAILCHPKPPPLVCIEEPELGLHPDILPDLAKLLKEASERTQLIVTTHSDILVGAFSDKPEVVLVSEKTDTGTTLTRLNPEELQAWLKDYSLGQLWQQGQIGGTRW